jgi:AcrR family transcriptional regulator
MSVEVQRGYAKGRAKRREIIDQAMALFGEVGYRGASLREIAARCGISHPGLLHHFPTKESLLLAVLEHRDEVDIAWVGLDQTDGVVTLRRIVELYAVLSAEATSAEHPAHAFFVERYQTSVGAAVAAYRQAGDAGELRPEVDPEIAGRQLIALMDGMQVQWLLDGGRTDMIGAVRALVSSHLTIEL